MSGSNLRPLLPAMTPKASPKEYKSMKYGDFKRRQEELKSSPFTVYMLVRVSSSTPSKPHIMTGVHVYSTAWTQLSTPEFANTIWSEWLNGSALYSENGIKFMPKAGMTEVSSDDIAALPEQGPGLERNNIKVEAHSWTRSGVESWLRTRVQEYMALDENREIAAVEWWDERPGVKKGAKWTDGHSLHVWWEIVSVDLRCLDGASQKGETT